MQRCWQIVDFCVERFLLAWLLLFSLAAFYWQQILPGMSDPFSASQPYLPGIIALTMFTIGSLLPKEEIDQVFHRWPTVLGGTAVQYISMPLLAFGFGWLCGFRGPLLTGIVMAGCVPGAMASNVLTLTARANVSYSVSLTTSATLLSPLLVPLALKLTLGQWRTFPAGKMSLTLLLTVVLPVVAGHVISRLSPSFERVMKRIGPILANTVILWIIAVVVALNRDRLEQCTALLLFALLGLNLGGYLAGNLGARLMRLPISMRRALTLEVGMQNAGLGTMLVLQVFGDEPSAAIPTALYTFGCMFTGTILARIWAEFGKQEAKENKKQPSAENN